MRLIILPVLFAIALSGACGPSAGSGRGTTAASIDVPREVTDDDFARYERVYWGLALDDPARPQLRERLLAFLDRRTPAILESDDYDAAVGHFARMAELFTPADFGEGRMPRELVRVARYLRQHGSPRGDEPRVLSALLVLRADRERHDAAQREYEEVAEWGRDARGTLGNPIERFSRLIDVWQEHARLTPSPEVLDLLARMHMERRDAILAMATRGEGVDPTAMSMADLRNAPILVRRAPLDVAGVYLAHGDIASAITRVEAMGDTSGVEERLLRVLRDAREGDDDALIELAVAYLEGRPDVTLGLCRLGHRQNPEEPQYVICLARVAAAAGELPKATGWYAEAVRLAPEEREIYDEALSRLAEFIARGLFDADPSDTRGMAQAAEGILEQRLERWADDEPEISQAELFFVIGLLEMNAGDTGEAKRRFEASLEADENARAHIELGRIAESTGHPDSAAHHYRRALDLTPAEGPAGNLARAELMKRLGDSFATGGERQQAERMYRQALATWDEMLASLHGEALSDAQLERGLLLDRLGRREEAATAFRQAMAEGPPRREVYAQILSHLVVTEPDLALAREVFETAQLKLTLEPEWKVYFALWLDAIAARAGEQPSEEVRELLRAHSEGQAWWGRLARFGTGALGYEELLSEASNTGERTEAHFYEGTRLLAAGDRDAAFRLFRLVLETQMVNFYEFIMALELIEQEAERTAHRAPAPASSP